MPELDPIELASAKALEAIYLRQNTQGTVVIRKHGRTKVLAKKIPLPPYNKVFAGNSKMNHVNYVKEGLR